MEHAFETATGIFAIEATHKKDTMDRCDECGAEKPKFGYANSPELFCEDCYFSKIKGTPREANIIKKAQHKMDVAPASSGTCVSKGCGKPATQTLTTPHYPEDGKTSSNSFCKEHGDQIRNAYGHSAQHTDDRQWKADATDKTKSGGYWSSPAGKQELRQAEKIKKLYPNAQKEAQHEGKPGCKTCGGSGSVKANAWGSERCPKCNPNPYNAKHSKEKLLGKLCNAWKEAKMGRKVFEENTTAGKQYSIGVTDDNGEQLKGSSPHYYKTRKGAEKAMGAQHEVATGKFAEDQSFPETSCPNCNKKGKVTGYPSHSGQAGSYDASCSGCKHEFRVRAAQHEDINGASKYVRGRRDMYMRDIHGANRPNESSYDADERRKKASKEAGEYEKSLE